VCSRLRSVSLVFFRPAKSILSCTKFCMGWLRFVELIKLKVFFAEYNLFYRSLLHQTPIILLILLTEAIPGPIVDALVQNVNSWNKISCRVLSILRVRRKNTMPPKPAMVTAWLGQDKEGESESRNEHCMLLSSHFVPVWSSKYRLKMQKSPLKRHKLHCSHTVKLNYLTSSSPIVDSFACDSYDS